MLGHGSGDGLFGHYDYIIDDDFAPILQTKETVCIWCNADKYVERNNLKGFYTGMFISDVIEAEYMGIETSTQKGIMKSNDLFAKSMGKHIFNDNVLKMVKSEYNSQNHVVNYNNNRLYFNN